MDQEVNFAVAGALREGQVNNRSLRNPTQGTLLAEVDQLFTECIYVSILLTHASRQFAHAFFLNGGPQDPF